MPRILNGETVQGQGATGICVNNTLVMPNGGTPAWVNPNLVVGQAAYPTSAWNVVTVLPEPAMLWTGGADVVCAGSGTIAAGLNSSSPYTRLQNQQPLRSIPTLIPLDVDRALGIAILYNRSVGNGISVFYANNAGMTADVVIPTGPLLSARILSGVVTWIEAQASGWVAVCYDLLTEQYIPVQTQPGSVYQALVFSAQNQRWVIYSNQAGAVLVHPTTDPSHGHTAPPQAFGLDGEVQENGTLLAAWCGNIGESAGSLVTVSWSLTQLEPIGPQPPIPPDPEPPEPPQPEPPQPEPIPPGPQPPIPIPPGVPMTIAFDLAQLGVNAAPKFTEQVTVVPHPDGHGLSGFQYADGKYASWSGTAWDVHKSSMGVWERFLVPASGQGAFSAYRQGFPTAAFPCVQDVVLA